MKIAQIVSTFPPYRAGMGNVAYHYSLELSKLGHEVTVLVPKRALDSARAKERPQTFKEFRIIELPAFLKAGNAAMPLQLLGMAKKYDILHLHYPFFGGAFLIWLVKLFRRKTKLVITYHMDFLPKGFFQGVFSLPDRFVRRSLFKLADKVIVPSVDYASESQIGKDMRISFSRFIELPLGVDLDKFKPRAKDPELIKKYKLNSDHKIILFVGSMDRAHYFKGVDILLEALKLVRKNNDKARLILVGQGKLRKEYENLAGQLGIGREVVFAGEVTQEDLPKFYNLADVCVLPSINRGEAFGLVLIEAMASGKPVIASNLAGVREVVNDGVNGWLVRPGQAEELASKLDYFLANPEVAQEFGQMGLNKAKKNYNWGVIGLGLERVYTSL